MSKQLWSDDSGALIALEWVMFSTVLVAGVITGLVAVRQAVIAELHDVANSLLSMNQSFSFAGQSNALSWTAGSSFKDYPDSVVVKSTAATPGGFDNRAID